MGMDREGKWKGSPLFPDCFPIVSLLLPHCFPMVSLLSTIVSDCFSIVSLLFVSSSFNFALPVPMLRHVCFQANGCRGASKIRNLAPQVQDRVRDPQNGARRAARGVQNGVQRAPLGLSGALLGLSWRSFGVSWALLVHFWTRFSRKTCFF